MTHPKQVLFFALSLLTPLTASAVPTQVNHEGYLADSVGTPVDGVRTITFGIYETRKFGSPFWTEVHEVDVVNGHYTIVLGKIQPLDGDLFIGDTLYLEVDTGGFRPGARAPMVSTPYAFRADEATSLSGGPVDATEIWVDGSQVVDTDGNWVGGTLTIDWANITGVPADFADGIDDVLTEAEVDAYADNNGYAQDSDLFSGDWADLTGIPSDVMDGDGDLLADMSCLDGDIIVWDGVALAWTCDLDADSVLTEAEVDAYVSNNGFALTADLATVATSGAWSDLTGVPADADTQLTEAEVDAYADNNGYALSSDLATVATSGAWSDLVGTPSDADTLASLGCGDGDLPIWNAGTGAWLCNNHTSNPDAHHSSTSDGLNITPASVTIQSTMTALNDGSLDLGAAVDDELTAAMVQTLTGGGLADSLHNHTADGGAVVSGGGGGGCVTLYGQDSCPDGFNEVLAGESVMFGTAGPVCMDTDVLGSPITGGTISIHGVGPDASYWDTFESPLPCTICCDGGGGAVSSTANGISFKGVTTTTQLGDVGLAQLNADCHAEFQNSRMCRMNDLMEMYPAPVPGIEARVLALFHALANDYYSHQMPDGSIQGGTTIQNCSAGIDTTSFSTLNASYRGTTVSAIGNFSSGNNCNTAIPTACCGP